MNKASTLPLHPPGIIPMPVIVELPEQPEMETNLYKLQEAVVLVVPVIKIQKLYVRYVLARCGGNVTHAAKYLGISRRTIQRWAKQDGIHRT